MLKLFYSFLGLAGCCNALAQFSIQGKVLDESSEALIGATVQLIDENRFAVTDDIGFFSIQNVSVGDHVLVVRFVGYLTREIPVKVSDNTTVEVFMSEDTRLAEEVVVYATRASEKSPTTFTNINKEEIKKQNFGQDLPFVLNWTPSLVTTSDAGAGVGYTGLRIRGSDATRVNVTINGVPYNDSESQGVFWVNIPDIAFSAQSVQIQRGVGTSTNGAGAFGATVNLSTLGRNDKAYADLVNSFGSFDTKKHTIGLGTGLINDRFTFDARASFINSDGFIDRASSNLRSYYAAAGFYGEQTILKAIVFGGKEVTYQSWYGVPESRLNNDQAAMLETASVEGWNAGQVNNLLTSDSRTFNIYDYKNQVDNYQQDHFQFHVSHRFSSALTANASLHYTPGRGYYEEFKFDQTLTDYGLAEPVVNGSALTNSDLVRRRWLDNDFYGITYSVNYEKKSLSSVFGGGWNRYEGDHFGEIIWAEVALTAPKDFRYYYNYGDKKDFNVFWKNNFSINSRISAYVDLQYRRVDYNAEGIENDLNNFNVGAQYNFFNPKIGASYQLNNGAQLYASYGVGQREPVREDFVNAGSGLVPRPEKLNNVEAGYRIRKASHSLTLNYYLMDYNDQLVLTGAVNDVGAPIRTNVCRSYRTGIELEGGAQISSKFYFAGNVTLSQNKIREFTEIIYDYGLNFDEFNEVQTQLENVDISFSPSVIVGASLTYRPLRKAEVTLLSKYVGDQFLDNTSNSGRKIGGYWVNDFRLSYDFQVRSLKQLSLSALLNNVYDLEYESNGYTYGFAGGGQTFRQNYYYPQAGRNVLIMASLKF